MTCMNRRAAGPSRDFQMTGSSGLVQKRLGLLGFAFVSLHPFFTSEQVSYTLFQFPFLA